MMADDVNQVTFMIPLIPPSVNSLFNIIYAQRRVEKKPEVRAFCYRAKEYVKAIKLSENSLVRMDAVFSYPFHHKNGRLRKFDSQNLIKVVADVVADKCGFDDSRIKHGSWASIDSASESVTVTLTELEA
jgi:Holliday junction resolvase RusA-like endonuclease